MARKKTVEAAAEPVEPAPVQAPAVVSPTVTLGRKDLLERVRAVSGAKKKDIKVIVEATLALMGEALARGEVLHLPPFGVARVTRGLDGEARSLVVKLRRARLGEKPGKAAKQTLAEADEAD
jgi:nucleoid DNA-binding protein